MSQVSAKALIMVVSRTDAIERAVERLSPGAVGIISSQEVLGVVAVVCHGMRDRARFLYGIVDSAMEIADAFGRFEKLLSDLEDIGYSPDDIALDATGGTAPMKIGAALAAMTHGVRMIHQRVPQDHIDGEWKRDESKEVEIVPMDNPLESTGLLREGQGVELFDRRDYGAAALIFHDVASRVEGAERSHYYTGLALLSEGYAAWDVADYGEALSKLPAARRELSVAFSDATFADRAAKLSDIIAANLGFLQKVRGNLSMESVVDMLENARRRIEDQSRYDDGVARLYRCIEMMHQWNLHKRYGLTTTGANWNKVPEDAKAKFMERTGMESLPEDLDLMRSRVLDHTLSGVEDQDDNLFRDLLQQRNNSILAHGFRPIKAASANNFLEYVDSIVARPNISQNARHPYLGEL